jgi:hypothetical protein
MFSERRPPQSGFNLAAVRERLAGLPERRLDFDFLGVDTVGNVAVFLGDDDSPAPRAENAQATSALLEELARSIDRTAAVAGDGYRIAATRAREPIFDAPRSPDGGPLHEKTFEGYPHLVVAAADGAEVVRRLMSELGGREVATRQDFFGAAVDVLGWVSYAELHEGGACSGCRVLDDPIDPRPRAPEALAKAGLYVYGFAKIAGKGEWLRIVSPSVPVDREELQDVTRRSAEFEEVPLRFEDSLAIRGPLRS